MRGYPIGSLLFWELEPQNRDKWQVYSFVEDYTEGATHNQVKTPAGIAQLQLVLDGQQRLTSLLIGLKGSFSIKKKYLRWDNPNAWVKTRLYLDLMKDPRDPNETLPSDTYYGFRFSEATPVPRADQSWILVSKILDFNSEDKFDDFKEEFARKLPSTTDDEQRGIVRKNLDRLYRTVWRNDCVSYYIEHDQEYDRVLDIFIRANQGGTPLSKSDLMLSMMTAKWSSIDARQEILAFVDRLNTGLSHRNAFDKDFVMKPCLVLMDLPVQYKVQHFTNVNLDKILRNWGEIKNAIETTVRLINSFGIDRNTLSSANSVIPLVYYAFKCRTLRLLGTTSFDVSNALTIRRWLLAALLNNVFSGSSDNALRDAREVLERETRAGRAFPAVDVSARLATSGRNTSFDQFSVANTLRTSYGSKSVFLVLSLLYDYNDLGVVKFHQDHIFPRSMFSPESFNKYAIPSIKWRRYLELRDRLANLELLLDVENVEKMSKPFEDWLLSRDASFRKLHLIPNDEQLLGFGNFEEFVDARETLIRRRLTGLFMGASGETVASSA